MPPHEVGSETLVQTNIVGGVAPRLGQDYHAAKELPPWLHHSTGVL